MKLNRLMLIGRLTRDIEVRDVPNGKKVVSFTVATDEGYKGKDGQWVDKAEFTDVSYFTTEAGANFMSSRLHKGSLVYVEGRKETQTSEKDGVKKYFVKCVADEVRPLEKGTGDGAAAHPAMPTDGDHFEGGYNDGAFANDSPF